MTDSTPPNPAVPDPSASEATLRLIAWLIAVAATVLTPMVHLASSNPLETWATVLVACIGWSALWLLRRGYSTYMPHVVVFAVLTAASMAVMAFGSVRTAGGFLFVAAVAGAGIFLERRALIASVIYSVVSLGLLTLAERHAWMHKPNFQIGTKVWLTHSTVLVVVAVLVYYSRTRAQQAFASQMEELQTRKRAEQERDLSMQRFARIFRTSPSPMLAQSARSGVILDVNPAFERCFGYSREQLLGRTDGQLWADPVQRESYHQRLFANRRADQERVTGLRADGSTFEAQISSEMGNDPQDRLVITTVADFSAQNEAMDRLRRSEERFAKAFNFSPLKMTITRLSDGTFVEVNQARDPVQGLHREELLGKSTLDTGGWLNPQERQAFIQRIQRDGYVNGYETRMRHTDGRLIDAKMWAELIEIDGEDCILSCFVNTTEEKRREALLLSVAQGMTGETGEAFFIALTRHAATAFKADLVVVSELVADQQVQTLAVSKDGALFPNFAYSPHGTPCGQTLTTADLYVQESGLATAFPNEQPLTGVHAEAYVGQCLRDHDGTPIGVFKAMWRQPIALTAEMTALMSIFASRAAAELMRLRREREIQQLNATLEQRVRSRTAELHKLNAELDSFAYSVSHDLKSPLRAIDGFTQLLQESLGDRLSAQEQDTFGRVLAATQRMAKLIADLLALARISQGGLNLGLVNLSEMALQILQAEQRQQAPRRLQWRVEPDLTVQCDARLLHIALENLIGNAVKYTREQPEPLIEIGRVDEPGQSPQFFIRDNGAGFDMAHASRLFQPFQRLHRPSSGYEGTGIGLATVRRIVERHGGRIQGRGRSDAGAEFRFSLASDARWLPAPSDA